MATTTDYLTQLQTDKQTLVTNLVAKGVEADNSETFTTLVPKVADIQSGGDISDYFTSILPSGGYANKTDSNFTTSGINGSITKIPNDFQTFGYPTQDTYYNEVGYALFRGCYNLTDCSALMNLPTTALNSLREAFTWCSSLQTIPLFDISNVKNMSMTFHNCKKLQNIPSFNTVNVTSMNNAFSNCESLTSIPELNTSKVTSLQSIFYKCTKLETVPLLNCQSCVNVIYAFSSCQNLTTLGGFQNLGQAYKTTQSANYAYYKLDLSASTKLTEQSLINVLNNLYDIATAGCNTQQVVLGTTNLAKLTSEEGQAALANAQTKGWTVS